MPLTLKKSFYLFIYGFVLAVEMYAVATQNKALEFIVKPFLTIVLAVMYFKLSNRKNYYYIAILALSFFVDMALINRSNDSFLMLAIGLLTLIYILYIKILRTGYKKVSVYRFVISFLPFLVCLGLFFSLSKSHLEGFLFPLLIQTILLFFIVNLAFFNYMKSNRKEDLYLFLGLFSFIIADSTFAFYRWFFVTKMYYLIMATFFFALAQVVICKALITKSLHDVE